MKFVLTTHAGGTFAVDGNFMIGANGVLVVDDPATDRRTQYSPAEWVRLEQQIPSAKNSPMPRIIDGSDMSVGGF